MNILECTNLTHTFDDRTVLNDINLSIKKHQRIVILGHSGSGKSLLLKCLMGLLQPDQGVILWQGHNLSTQLEQFRQKLGVIFQKSLLFDHLTVWENVGLFLLYNQKKSASYVKEKVLETLPFVSLDANVMEHFPHQLSGGMQRRVALARALIMQPNFWICDEPTTGLDPDLTQSIAKLMIQITKHATLLTVTHDYTYAKIVGTHFYRMNKGVLQPLKNISC